MNEKYLETLFKSLSHTHKSLNICACCVIDCNNDEERQFLFELANDYSQIIKKIRDKI